MINFEHESLEATLKKAYDNLREKQRNLYVWDLQ